MSSSRDDGGPRAETTAEEAAGDEPGVPEGVSSPPSEPFDPGSPSERSRSASIASDVSGRNGRPPRTPSFEAGLIGHGETTYMPVPTDKTCFVFDETQLYAVRRRPAGMVAGSAHGHYLDAYHREKELDNFGERLLAYEREKPEEEQMEDIWDRIREQDCSKNWVAGCIERELMKCNPSTWMNETWGGPIRGRPRRGGVRRLSAQYGGGRTNGGGQPQSQSPGKRRSREEAASPSPKKKLKKQHKKFTAPQMERDGVSGRSIILHGPRRPPQADAVCSVCRVKQGEGGKQLFVCPGCQQNAYCSRECQREHAAWHEPQCKAPWRRSSDAAEGMLNLSIRNDQEDYAEGSRTVLDRGDHFRLNSFFDNPDQSGVDPMTLSDEYESDEEMDSSDSDEEHESLMADPRNYAHDDEEMVGAGALSEKILGMRRTEDGRGIEYGVGQAGIIQQYLHADGDYFEDVAWNAEITDFWGRTEDSRRTLRLLQSPELGNVVAHEPGPWSRFIVRARLRDHGRELWFDVREFERLNGPDQVHDEYGEGLGEEWQEAIDRFWARLTATEQWQRAADRVRRLDFVPDYVKRDSLMSEEAKPRTDTGVKRVARGEEEDIQPRRKYKRRDENAPSEPSPQYRIGTNEAQVPTASTGQADEHRMSISTGQNRGE